MAKIKAAVCSKCVPLTSAKSLQVESVKPVLNVHDMNRRKEFVNCACAVTSMSPSFIIIQAGIVTPLLF